MLVLVQQVILLNLLIAQMTSAYDQAKKLSVEYRLLQRARTALECRLTDIDMTELLGA